MSSTNYLSQSSSLKLIERGVMLCWLLMLLPKPHRMICGGVSTVAPPQQELPDSESAILLAACRELFPPPLPWSILLLSNGCTFGLTTHWPTGPTSKHRNQCRDQYMLPLMHSILCGDQPCGWQVLNRSAWYFTPSGASSAFASCG